MTARKIQPVVMDPYEFLDNGYSRLDHMDGLGRQPDIAAMNLHDAEIDEYAVREDHSIPRWEVYPVGARWATGQVHPTYGVYTASERIFDTFKEAAQYRDDQMVPGPKSGMLIPAPEPQPSWDDMSWRERVDSIKPGLAVVAGLCGFVTVVGFVAAWIAGLLS